MAKIKKEQLERLVRDGAELAGSHLSVLMATRCPYRQEYDRVEGFMAELAEVATDLGLDMKGLLRGEVERPRTSGFGFQYEGRK